MKIKAIERLNDGNRFVVPMFLLLFIEGKERKIIIESFDLLVRWRLQLHVSTISHETLIWSYYIFREKHTFTYHESPAYTEPRETISISTRGR